MTVDRTSEINKTARALRDLFGTEVVGDLYEQVNNYGEGDHARTLADAMRLALAPACPRCRLPLSGLAWCQPCNPGTPPPSHIDTDRETAYGHTSRAQRSVRVF